MPWVAGRGSGPGKARKTALLKGASGWCGPVRNRPVAEMVSPKLLSGRIPISPHIPDIPAFMEGAS